MGLINKTMTLGRTILTLLALYAAHISDGSALADTQTNGGTARVYAATLDLAVAAITNAFSSRRYHNMAIIAEPYQYDMITQRWSKRPATNEWSLYTEMSPLTEVLWEGKMVSYFPEFDITAKQLVTNQCKITVRTISAWIPDGKEIGIHGGLSGHAKHIPPILQEETNVLSQIEMELRVLQSGATNQPVTIRHLDTDPDWLLQWRDLGESNPQLREKLIGAIQEETNSSKREALQKLLTEMTNSVPK